MLLEIGAGLLGVGVAGAGAIELAGIEAAFPDQAEIIFPDLIFGDDLERVGSMSIFQIIEAHTGELPSWRGVAARARRAGVARPCRDGEKLHRREERQGRDDERAMIFHGVWSLFQ